MILSSKNKVPKRCKLEVAGQKEDNDEELTGFWIRDGRM